jgi:hypothetical protein
MKRIFAGVLALSMCGCVSSYTGPKPDFSLTGEAAKKERDKFQFQKYWFLDGAGYYYMGPEDEDTLYTGSSLKPIIQDVSPAAIEKEKVAQRWQWVNYALIGAAVGYIVSQREDLDTGDWLVFYGTLLASVGAGHYSKYKHRQSIDDYNRDLDRKFTPALSYNWRF